MKSTADDTDPAELLDRLLELTLLLTDDMDRELARVGLSPPRAHLIWVLAERGASMQQQLATDLKVTARNITALVDGLTESGFVSREVHPTDRRAFLVTLTEKGRRTVDQLARERVELAEGLFGVLAGEERSALLAGLTGVTLRLNHQITTAGHTPAEPTP